MREILAVFPSYRQARRLLDEMALTGGVKFVGHQDKTLVYASNGYEFRITKRAGHQWEVSKVSKEETSITNLSP